MPDHPSFHEVVIARDIARIDRQRKLNQQASTLKTATGALTALGLIAWIAGAGFESRSIITLGQVIAGVGAISFIITLVWKHRRLKQLG